MSKDFIISIASILAISGFIFIFKDSFKPWFEYVFSHTYIIAIIFDIILFGALINIKYQLCLKQNILVVLLVVLLAVVTTILAYFYTSSSLVQANIFIVSGYILYMLSKVKKITKTRSE